MERVQDVQGCVNRGILQAILARNTDFLANTVIVHI